MNRTALDLLETWFEGYVSGFYRADPQGDYPFRLKEAHTRRVRENIILICRQLDLPETDVVRAESMALLHDVGRFRQYAEYRTYADGASVNHARLGLREIACHKVLNGLDPGDKKRIARAVAFHNAAVLPDHLDGRTLFFARLLRDADKLDIWKIFCDYFRDLAENNLPDTVITLGLPDEPTYSANIIRSFQNASFASIQDMKTVTDFKLLQISWVFDLNFRPSFQLLSRRRYIERIAATLPPGDELDAAVARARRHVDRHGRLS